METWRRCREHPDYEVSDHARVRNSKGRILSQFRCNGYVAVGLAYGPRYVHRLVADSFYERAEGLDQVNHIDSDKTNSLPYNLEWCTSKHNSQHYVDNGLGVQTPYNLRDPNGKAYIGTNLNKLCKEFGLQQGNLHKVMKGQRKSHKGWTRGGPHV